MYKKKILKVGKYLKAFTKTTNNAITNEKQKYNTKKLIVCGNRSTVYVTQ